jgi:hypothetical protein
MAHFDLDPDLFGFSVPALELQRVVLTELDDLRERTDNAAELVEDLRSLPHVPRTTRDALHEASEHLHTACEGLRSALADSERDAIERNETEQFVRSLLSASDVR